MTIDRLPFERRPRNSIANNLDRINELVDWANLGTHLYASATGESVTVDVASSVKGLKVDGRSVQDGTPTPDAPVPVEVVEGRNLYRETQHKIGETWNPAANLTVTKNGYNEYTVNGTSSGTNWFYGGGSDLADSLFVTLEPGTYTASLGGDSSNLGINVRGKNSEGQTVIGYGAPRYTFTLSERTPVKVVITTSGSGRTYANQTVKLQLEAGSTATPYVPYDSIGIVVDDTAIPINLQGNTLASLPDGTRDELHVDSTGHVWIEKRVGVAVYDGSDDETIIQVTNTNQQRYNLPAMNDANQAYNCYNNVAVYRGQVPDSGMFSVYNGYMYLNVGIGTVEALRTWLADNHVTVAYPLKTPQTIDLGYIDPPAIPSGSVVTVSASLTPTLHLEWWVDDGITALVNDLIAYIDYKTEG